MAGDEFVTIKSINITVKDERTTTEKQRCAFGIADKSKAVMTMPVSLHPRLTATMLVLVDVLTCYANVGASGVRG